MKFRLLCVSRLLRLLVVRFTDQLVAVALLAVAQLVADQPAAAVLVAVADAAVLAVATNY